MANNQVREGAYKRSKETAKVHYTVDWKQGKAEVKPFDILIATPDSQPKLFQSMWHDALFMMLGDK